jgi:hypothetical protein
MKRSMQRACLVLFPARGRASCTPPHLIFFGLNLGVSLARYDTTPSTSSGNWYKCDDPYGCYLKVLVKPVKHKNTRDLSQTSQLIGAPETALRPMDVWWFLYFFGKGASCHTSCGWALTALGLLPSHPNYFLVAPWEAGQALTLFFGVCLQGDGNPAVTVHPYETDPSSGSFNPQAHTTWVPTSWESWPNYNVHGYGLIPALSESQNIEESILVILQAGTIIARLLLLAGTRGGGQRFIRGRGSHGLAGSSKIRAIQPASGV